jgi:cbb3-type cytochrome oxidase subunit 3
MTLPTLATVLVSIAFIGLIVWVARPANKARLEAQASIPFDDAANDIHAAREPRR